MSQNDKTYSIIAAQTSACPRISAGDRQAGQVCQRMAEVEDAPVYETSACPRFPMRFSSCVCFFSISVLLVMGSICHGSERKLIDDLRYIDDNHTQNKVRCVGWEEDGKRFGKWLFYYPNGIICQISTYNSVGNQDGQFLEFYDSGILGVCGQFENGKESGIWVGLHENAKMRYIANYGGGNLGKVIPPIIEWFTEEGVPKKQGVKGVVDSIETNLKAQVSAK